ncbi:hypothetical protein BJ085DRAFT_34343 [Dimargaris cristalligena]|uniref:Uncharacterized protein n=1 Tax=Dimargaris cristalligena TaxID=215637 RepID=A0A4P9ZN61_9FUNG|nr:hypothetical protein BJ085DRAFT_34343 [Dimargaris cristalligena]|eukprot:RKP34846.1 hypothetical protein BJ085DRAFT_34343 [Dimargaris cristalligena]
MAVPSQASVENKQVSNDPEKRPLTHNTDEILTTSESGSSLNDLPSVGIASPEQPGRRKSLRRRIKGIYKASVAIFTDYGSPDIERWVTSNLVSPRTLLLVRVLILLFSLATTVCLFVYEGYTFFYYFTDWSFLGLTLYFIMAVTISAVYCWHGESVSALDRWLPKPRPLRLAYWIWYESFATFHLLVPIIYWAALSRGFKTDTPLITYCSLAPHSLDLVILIIEQTLNRMRFYPSHVVFIVAVLAGYLVLTYVILAADGVYVTTLEEEDKESVETA